MENIEAKEILSFRGEENLFNFFFVILAAHVLMGVGVFENIFTYLCKVKKLGEYYGNGATVTLLSLCLEKFVKFVFGI